jgi:hypothetical protein
MTLRWHLYDKLYDLKVIEASFLWLEIEPTAELLESPPHEVNIVQQLINSELSRRATALLIDWKKDDPVGKLVIQLRITGIETEYITGRINQKEKDLKVFQAEITPVTQSERFNARASIPSTFKTVSLEDLREIAIKLNEKPKFLFPEMRTSIEEEALSRITDKPLPIKKRNSYLKLIKGLLKKQGINPAERGNIKQLIGMVENAGEILGKDAVGDILKEIQGLSES